MNKEEILKKIQDMLRDKVKLVSDASLITIDSNLINDFNIDSMKVVNFLVEIEKQFDIEMDSEEIEQDIIVDINKLVTFIESSLK